LFSVAIHPHRMAVRYSGEQTINREEGGHSWVALSIRDAANGDAGALAPRLPLRRLLERAWDGLGRPFGNRGSKDAIISSIPFSTEWE